MADNVISQTKDRDVVEKAVAQYADQILNLDVGEWLIGMGNIALTNDIGDVSMFERQWMLPKTVSGHYFFFSRGKEARAVAKEMLREIFTRSEEHTSELQSLMRISYAVFCLKKKI